MDHKAMIKNVEAFEKKINYRFKDKNNLFTALTHSSYANENKHEKLECNERLEFLGDSVLNIVTSEKIYFKYPALPEGEMTKIRAAIVCEASLVKCADEIELAEYILLGKGEELTGGRTRASILSDTFEALIGAVYVDGGFIKAKNFILGRMLYLIEGSDGEAAFIDYKTQLQELIQKNNIKKVIYEIVHEKGPDHAKFFISQVRIADKVMGTGEGRNKKAAEQNAAHAALDKLTK